MKRLAVLAAVLACLAAPSAGAWNRHYSLDETESWLAQRPVYVKCLTPWESLMDENISVWGAEAYVEITDEQRPDDHTTVASPWCDAVVHPERHSFEEYVIGVLILTHEAGHLRGSFFPAWMNEADVNCWAARRSSAVAVLRYGLDPDRRAEFDRVMWDVFRHQPKEYRKSGCTPH